MLEDTSEFSEDKFDLLRILVKDVVLLWPKVDQQAFADYLAHFVVTNFHCENLEMEMYKNRNIVVFINYVVKYDIESNFLQRDFKMFKENSFSVIFLKSLVNTMEVRNFITQKFEEIFKYIYFDVLEFMSLQEI